MSVEGLYLNQGVLAIMSGFIFSILSGNVSKNIQVRPITKFFQACLVTLLAYQFSLKNSYYSKSWSKMLSFKTCIQTLKESCLQTNQRYPIFLPRVQPSHCHCDACDERRNFEGCRLACFLSVADVGTILPVVVKPRKPR